MHWIVKLDSGLNKISRFCGTIASVAMILLVLNVFYDVIMRYAFNDVSIGMQELEWHLYSSLFLLGVPYAMQKDGHVRVDIFYEDWSDKAKAWINLLGVLVFVIPFVSLVVYYGIDFAKEAYELGESSGDPGGLPYRWVIKSVIPLSFALMAISSLGMITKALKVLILGDHYHHDDSAGLA